MSTAAAEPRNVEVVVRGQDLWDIVRTVRWHRRTTMHVFADWADLKQGPKRAVFAMGFQSTFLDEGEVAKALEASRFCGCDHLRYVLLPAGQPGCRESLPGIVCALKVRTADRIHTPILKHDSEKEFVRRFLTALARSSEQRTIADAWWEREELVVMSPMLERIRVPVSALPKVRHASVERRDDFEIDEVGEYLYWPRYDVHMGWEQFEQAADPSARLRAQQASDEFNRRYGQAIRTLRLEAGLRQTDIPDLDARTVGRVERGQARATLSALTKLSAAHHVPLDNYMSALADRL